MRKVYLYDIALLLAAAVFCPGQVVITEYSPPTTNSGPLLITAGPDGNLWFTENAAKRSDINNCA